MMTSSCARIGGVVLLLLWLAMGFARPARAQAADPPPPPPPLWDTQFGLSFVGTSGNTDTSTLGADFSLHHRWTDWQLESAATAVETSSNDVRTAERLMAQV